MGKLDIMGNNKSKVFLKHEKRAFFQKDETKNALRDLAKAEKILIYCGAGVTYDLTNLGWDDLIKEVFEESFKEEDEEKQTIMNLLNSTSLDAKQKASIVMTYLEKKEKQTNNDGVSEKEKIIITEKLQEILYKKRGWGRGNLLSNIVMLAMLLVKIGREVEIVTTNYDVYLLLEFKDFIRHQQEQPGRSIAGVKLKNFKNEELFTYMKETNGGGYVTVTFLHGRVDNDDKIQFPSGSIVFSEYSYAAMRKASLNYLVRQLREKTLLCLGSSLSDEPLVHALSAMKKKAKKGNKKQRKHYALVTLPLPLVADKNDDQKSSDHHEALIMRGENIGLTILDPACFRHIAQFIEELINVTKMQHLYQKDEITSAVLESKIKEFSFYSELQEWHFFWEKLQENKWADKLNYLILVDFLNHIKKYLESRHIFLGKGEILKLEAWVRTNPAKYVPTDTDAEDYPYRGLSVVADSMGPIYDPECWRREPLQRYSPVAAVRAFNDGKSSLMGLTSNLGFEGRASRWNSFLCVPIFYQKQYIDPNLPVFVRIPVGCIVLASTFHSSSTADNKVFLRHDRFKRDDFEKVIKIMRTAGMLIMTEDNVREREWLRSRYLS